ncbi:MAG: hypothetical protein HRT61_01170 [Ekhidna sp.]|nr:hypothetical protein [Ekhidna sp.]
MKTILQIPDMHIRANTDLTHCEALGNFIEEHAEGLDIIVNTGDGIDLNDLYTIPAKNISEDSLSEWCHYIDGDFQAHKQASYKIMGPYFHLIDRRRSQKKRIPKIRRVYTEGNHEYRFNRFMDKFKVSVGKVGFGYFNEMSEADLKGIFPYYGEFYRYRDVVSIEGINFSHAFHVHQSAVLTVDSIKKVNMASSVSGHLHKIRFDTDYAADQRPVFTYVGGCFMQDDPEYVDGSYQGHTSGVTLLHGVDGSGYFEPEFIGIDRLIREYL